MESPRLRRLAPNSTPHTDARELCARSTAIGARRWAWTLADQGMTLRDSVLAAGLTCLAMWAGEVSCGMIPPAKEVALSQDEWNAIRKEVKWPKGGLTHRMETAHESGGSVYVTIETNYYELGPRSFRYFQVSCRKLVIGWKCFDAIDTLQFKNSSQTVIVGDGVSTNEVIEVADFIRNHPQPPWKDKGPLLASVSLVSLKKSGGDFLAKVATVDRDCYTGLRIRRSTNATLSIINSDFPVWCS